MLNFVMTKRLYVEKTRNNFEIVSQGAGRLQNIKTLEYLLEHDWTMSDLGYDSVFENHT